MTEEQIAELDGLHYEAVDLAVPVFKWVRARGTAHDRFARLLEERKRLLTALREMLPVAEGASFERMVTGRADHALRIERRRENALAALAYAEEAAP